MCVALNSESCDMFLCPFWDLEGSYFLVGSYPRGGGLGLRVGASWSVDGKPCHLHVTAALLLGA